MFPKNFLALLVLAVLILLTVNFFSSPSSSPSSSSSPPSDEDLLPQMKTFRPVIRPAESSGSSSDPHTRNEDLTPVLQTLLQKLSRVEAQLAHLSERVPKATGDEEMEAESDNEPAATAALAAPHDDFEVSPASKLKWCGFINHSQDKREKKYPKQLVKTLTAFTSAAEKRSLKFYLILTDGCDEDYSDVQALSPWLQVVCIKEPHPQLKLLDPATRTKPPTWGDSMERELWRSKMALDFTYGMNLCKGADAVLTLEDDMVASYGFFARINEFVEGRLQNGQHPFSLIKLYHSGAGGSSSHCHRYEAETRALVFDGVDVEKLQQYILEKFADSPHDWLIRDYFNGKCSHIFSPSLFQHTGTMSTNNVNLRPETAPDFSQWGEP